MTHLTLNNSVTNEGHGMLKVSMSHGDKVLEMPEGFKLMGSTDSCPVAAMAEEECGFYALQFRPEVTHTTQGKAIIGRFVQPADLPSPPARLTFCENVSGRPAPPAHTAQ